MGTPDPARVARDLAWFLEHARADMPRQMHCRAFWADHDGWAGSFDGSPAWSRSFAHWLDRTARAIIVIPTEVECFHVGRSSGTICELCAIRDDDLMPIAESGIRRTVRVVYRYPMLAAMARLHNPLPRGLPPHATTLVALARASGNVRAAAAALARSHPVMGDKAMALRAIANALVRVRQVWHEEVPAHIRPAATPEDAAA